VFWLSELALADIPGRGAVRLNAAGASGAFPGSSERIFKSFVGTLHGKPRSQDDWKMVLGECFRACTVAKNLLLLIIQVIVC